jgi:hypothetical protein
MTAIQAIGKVNKKQQLLVPMPDDIQVGDYQVVVLFVAVKNKEKKHVRQVFSNHTFPIGNMTFSRSEMYGDGGR